MKKSLVVLGASDIEKPMKFGSITNYDTWLEELAKTTLMYFDNLFFIPDHGTYVDFAQKFHSIGGNSTAVKPTADTPISKAILKHTDEVISIPGGQGWTFLNTHFVSLAPVALCLSYSAGSILEICSSKYSMIYEGKKTKILIDQRGVSSSLPPEIEAELYDVEYFNNNSQLTALYEKTWKQ
jgi:hypothetical protein